MRFSLSDSFKVFFKENGVLELEEIIPFEEADLLSKKTDNLLTKHSGRNLWKIDPSHKKILSQAKTGEIISFLLKQKPIRLAYTQVLSKKTANEFPSESKSLEEISSAGPILGGAILCLKSSSEASDETLPDLAKQTAGNIIFFSKDHPIPFPEILKQEGYQGILIAFAPNKVRYQLQPLDIYTHELKKSGYVFGDLLSVEESPYIYH